MKNILIPFAFITLILISSCKKEIEKETNPLETVTNKLNPKAGDILWQATPAQIKKMGDDFRSQVLNNHRNKNIAGRFFDQGYMDRASSNLISTQLYSGSYNPSCGSGQIRLEYFVTISETATRSSTFTESFSAVIGLTTFSSSSVSLVNETSDLDPLYYDGWATWGKEYRVVYIVDNSNYAVYANLENTITSTYTGTNTVNSITNSVSLDPPNSYYESIPATVYVFPLTGHFYVYDKCTVLLCGSIPHYMCPSSSTFKPVLSKNVLISALDQARCSMESLNSKPCPP